MKLPAYQELSVEQDRVNNLPLTGNYLVTGPPGTGKTVMALYRSQMLATRGEPVKLLMHGNLLSQYTKQAIAELELDDSVSTFHSWMYDWHRETWGSAAPQLQDWVFDWTTIVDRAIEEPPPRDEMAHLLVDEGQDMPAMFFTFARAIAADLTVFADENQRITEHNSTLEEIRQRVRPDVELPLTRNYRNTREIACVAKHFHQGASTGVPEMPQRQGPRPVLTRHPRVFESVKQIADYATTFRHQQIGVLVPTLKVMTRYLNRLSSALPRQMLLQHYRSDQRDLEVDFSRPGVTVVAWASAKGLEFDVVFVPELQAVPRDLQDPTFLMQMYVLCSRARERLFFSFSGEGRPPIVDIFPLEEMEVTL